MWQVHREWTGWEDVWLYICEVCVCGGGGLSSLWDAWLAEGERVMLVKSRHKRQWAHSQCVPHLEFAPLDPPVPVDVDEPQQGLGKHLRM